MKSSNREVHSELFALTITVLPIVCKFHRFFSSVNTSNTFSLLALPSYFRISDLLMVSSRWNNVEEQSAVVEEGKQRGKIRKMYEWKKMKQELRTQDDDNNFVFFSLFQSNLGRQELMKNAKKSMLWVNEFDRKSRFDCCQLSSREKGHYLLTPFFSNDFTLRWAILILGLRRRFDAAGTPLGINMRSNFDLPS